MACGRFGSLLRCCVHPMAMQPIFVPLFLDKEREGGWVLEELKELEEVEELEGCL